MATLPAAVPGCNSGRPVRRPRLRPTANPTTPAPTNPPTPASTACHTCGLTAHERTAAEAEAAARLARYEVLVGTRANRLGHEIVAAAEHLMQLLTDFEHVADSPDAHQRFRRAGVNPTDPSGLGEFGPDHFEGAAEDALGFSWSLDVFMAMFRSGLVRNPADPPPPSRRRS